MFTPRPAVDRLVQDRQHDLLAEAGANRLAQAGRPRRSWRWREGVWRRHPAVDGATSAGSGPTSLAEVLAEIGATVETALTVRGNPREVSEMAKLVARIAHALQDVGALVGLPAVDPDDPAAAVVRWLGRLSERTISTNLALDATRRDVIDALVAELRSLGYEAATGTQTASPARRPWPLPADLPGAPACAPR